MIFVTENNYFQNNDMGRKDYGDKNTKLRGAGKVAKRQAGFDKTGTLAQKFSPENS